MLEIWLLAHQLSFSCSLSRPVCVASGVSAVFLQCLYPSSDCAGRPAEGRYGCGGPTLEESWIPSFSLLP